MGLETRDDGLYAVCTVCETEMDAEAAVWETVGEGERVSDLDDWYIHIHRFDEGDAPLIEKEDTYAFCPDHLPETAFPTADEDPDFDIDAAVEQLEQTHRSES